MKVWLCFLCTGLVLAICTAGIITVFTIMKKEKYKTMKNLGKFPKHIGLIKSSGHPIDDDYDSMKYRNHRYERQRVRSHSPNKVYIDHHY